jgi:hypothetical protein
MDEFLVWDETLTFAYFNIYGIRADDLEYLKADARFAPVSQETPSMHKAVFFLNGLWFTGYYMSTHGGKILIQRAYGKIVSRLSKQVLRNKNKFITVPKSDVLIFKEEGFGEEQEPPLMIVPARALTTRNVKIPLCSAYTLFMISDMIKTAKICSGVDQFKQWLDSKYIQPSRINTTEMFRIPHFESPDDAISFLGEFRKNYPDQYAVFDEDGEADLAAARIRL